MAACPHAAIAGQRGPRAQWFRRAGLAGCGRPALRTKSMMRCKGGGVCGWRSASDPGGGGPMWASAPMRRNHRTSQKSGAGPGGHTGRPYEETGGGAVGAACMAARAHRRVGCTIAERTPHGIENKSTIAERTRCGGASGDGAKYTGPVVDAAGFGRIYNPPLQGRKPRSPAKIGSRFRAAM